MELLGCVSDQDMSTLCPKLLLDWYICIFLFVRGVLPQ